MYLAPLNYDRFFKKIFSDISIAKHFLEDFFDITIQEIELLPNRHKLTDEAKIIRFDFRCKIDGKYVIIEMQQWYKADVVKRFYLYHAANTVLQLEDLPNNQSKKSTIGKIKSYNNILPIRTLIWMVDDTLGFREDYVTFQTSPKILSDFIKNDQLWANSDKTTLSKERNKILKLLHNDTKNLSFLQKNPMIFAFQRNIIRNKKIKKYVRWFRFAEQTRGKSQKADFTEFLNDKTFETMITKLTNYKEVTEEKIPMAEFIKEINRHHAQYEKNRLEDLKEEYELKMQEQKHQMQERERKIQEQLMNQIQALEKQFQQELETKIINEKKSPIINLIKRFPNLSDAEIANIQNTTTKQVTEIRKTIQS